MSTNQSLKIITLEKRATVDCALQIRTQLLEALAGSERVLVDLSRIESADLTTIQLLYAAAREAAIQQKELGFTGTVSDAVRNALEDGGFCKHAPADAQWLGGDLLDLHAGSDGKDGSGSEQVGESGHGYV